MKKFNIIKILQLVLMLAFLAVCAYLMFVKRGLFHDVAQDPDLRMVSGMLWACFALEFIFIFVDFGIFSDYKRDQPQRLRRHHRAVSPAAPSQGGGLRHV